MQNKKKNVVGYLIRKDVRYSRPRISNIFAHTRRAVTFLIVLCRIVDETRYFSDFSTSIETN